MLATCKNVLLQVITQAPVIIKVLGHQYWWLAGAYDLEIEHFQKWLASWLPGGYIVAFCAVVHKPQPGHPEPETNKLQMSLSCGSDSTQTIVSDSLFI